jgi:hypothetical protein
MSRTKLVLAAVAALALVSVVGGGFFLLGGSNGSAEAKSGAPAAVTREQPTQEPPTRLSAAESPAAKQTEAPVVKPYATKLSGHTFGAEPEVPAAKRKKDPAGAGDSCDHNYGRVPVCVPWDFPEGIRTPADKCAYLKNHGIRTVPVTGKDRQGLDADRNGIACDQ